MGLGRLRVGFLFLGLVGLGFLVLVGFWLLAFGFWFLVFCGLFCWGGLNICMVVSLFLLLWEWGCPKRRHSHLLFNFVFWGEVGGCTCFCSLPNMPVPNLGGATDGPNPRRSAPVGTDR